jgi:hypothetical protein
LFDLSAVDNGPRLFGIKRENELDVKRIGLSSVYILCIYNKEGREKEVGEKGRGLATARRGVVGSPFFSIIPSRHAKWGTTHMLVSFPATSSGISPTTQRHRGHHICMDPCPNPFFQALRQAFPTPPLLFDPTSSHRNDPTKRGEQPKATNQEMGKGSEPEKRRNSLLSEKAYQLNSNMTSSPFLLYKRPSAVAKSTQRRRLDGTSQRQAPMHSRGPLLPLHPLAAEH